MKRILRTESAFTLLEVMIAFAIMVVVLAAAFITQSGSLAASTRNKGVIVATNLARNLINEEEVKYEGVALDRLPKTRTENFPEPNDEYKWTVAYEEVDFTALTDLIAKQREIEAAKSDTGEGGSGAQEDMILNIFKDYLKKSVRRMTVTIEWPEGSGVSTQTFTQLVVNYDTELDLTL